MLIALVGFLFLLAMINFTLNRNSILSLSLFSILSFLFSSLTYFVFYREVGSDLSFYTSSMIFCSLIAMMIGERIGTKIGLIKRSYANHINKTLCTPKKTATIIIFILEIVIFVIRYIDLIKFANELGVNINLFNVLNAIRLPYALGQYSDRGIFMTGIYLATIIVELISYLYLYIGLQNIILKRKNKQWVFMPVVGYLMIVLTFTGRAEFIKYGSIAIMFYAWGYVNNIKRSTKTNQIIAEKLIKYLFIFGIIFFSYSYIFRNTNTVLTKEIVSYIGASEYGLNSMIGKNLYGIDGQVLTFGYYTLQSLHSFMNNIFGLNIPVPSFRHLPFFVYANGSSNIYTSLLYPYLDFGFVGVLITRFFLGLIGGLLLNYLRNQKFKNSSSKLCILVITGILLYCSISAAIADRYYDFILSPNEMLKYSLLLYTVAKISFRKLFINR